MLMYYGMLRISEIASFESEFQLDHALKVGDVHVGQNKPKILLVLQTSKTHGKESLPQKIKIEATALQTLGEKYLCKTHFCPFAMVREYMCLRGPHIGNRDHFFLLKHGEGIKPKQIRNVLHSCISGVGLEKSYYDLHSMRSGRALDLVKAGFTISQVKIFGRWCSNAIYRYLKGIP